jgi:hypothetical protein
LPSIKELDEMYKNKATLETVPGFTGFTAAFYWSSTEYDTGSGGYSLSALVVRATSVRSTGPTCVQFELFSYLSI